MNWAEEFLRTALDFSVFILMIAAILLFNEFLSITASAGV